jgi:AbrB family looped-hinge helix DNA binding protein
MLAIVTDKGQVTVPKEIRDRLGIEPGVKLDFQVEPDGSLRVRPLTRGAAGLFGLLHDPRREGKAATIEEMNDAVSRHLAEDDARIVRAAAKAGRR